MLFFFSFELLQIMLSREQKKSTVELIVGAGIAELNI